MIFTTNNNKKKEADKRTKKTKRPHFCLHFVAKSNAAILNPIFLTTKQRVAWSVFIFIFVLFTRKNPPTKWNQKSQINFQKRPNR